MENILVNVAKQAIELLEESDCWVTVAPFYRVQMGTLAFECLWMGIDIRLVEMGVQS